MFSQLLLLSAIVLQCALAYTISQDCLDPGFISLGINIPVAVAEALSIAEYAQWRLQTNSPAIGPVLQQLLGNDGNARSNFINRMGALPTAFGPLTGTFTPLATGLDNTIVIKCNAVLTQVTDANGITLGWRDADFPSMPIISGAQEPCDDATDVAFTYRTGLSRTQNIAGIANVGPSHVITLCSWHPGQAMYRHNTIGTDWSQRNWAGLSFDTIGQYLPPTLLHEGMHVVGLPGILPSGSPGMYQWSNIVTSNRNDDKQANADSYSILASVLWMKRHTVGSQGLWGRRHPALRRPGDSPNDGHP